MVNNRYENETDIPDFVETKEEKDTDLSVFKFDETENTERLDLDDDDEEYDDEEDDDEDYDRPRHKLSTKGIFVIGGVVIVALLIATIAGWVYGIGQHNQYAKINTQYSELQTKLNATNSELSTAKQELEELQSKSGNVNPDVASGTCTGTYKLAADVKLRSEPSVNGQEQPNGLKAGDEVQVTEISAISDDDNGLIVWARTSDGYYFALIITDTNAINAEKVQ